jgi:hypothetical protein
VVFGLPKDGCRICENSNSAWEVLIFLPGLCEGKEQKYMFFLFFFCEQTATVLVPGLVPLGRGLGTVLGSFLKRLWRGFLPTWTPESLTSAWQVFQKSRTLLFFGTCRDTHVFLRMSVSTLVEPGAPISPKSVENGAENRGEKWSAFFHPVWIRIYRQILIFGGPPKRM